MEIIEDKILLIKTEKPEAILSSIKTSAYVQRINDTDVHEILVKWSLQNTRKLSALGLQNVPSPILSEYNWPGLFIPKKHQKMTAAFFTLYSKAFCFSDPGTGKTASAIWAADYLMSKGLIKRALVIAPLSILRTVWYDELSKLVGYRKFDIAYGTQRERKVVVGSDAEFVIINYDGIKSVEGAIKEARFDLFIVDECTAFKHANTKLWKSGYRLFTENKMLWLMTGTPMAQRPLDVYGIAKFVNPVMKDITYSAWRDKTMVKLTNFKYAPKENIETYIHEILQPAIRFSREECVDLPNILYTMREIPLSKEQEKAYDLMRKELYLEFADTQISAVNAAVKLVKLLQIASGSVYSDDGDIIQFDCLEKLKELKTCIEEAHKKVLVFAQFRHTADVLSNYLKSENIVHHVVNGAVPYNKRSNIFNDFQKAQKTKVLIMQPQSVAHGLTLTEANTCIWWSPTTSVETWLQANARIYREGQSSNCHVIRFYSVSVEKKLYDALDSKVLDQNRLLNLFKSEVLSYEC